MQQRCENPNNDRYENYGGRGIKMCERWKSFDNFLADMGERPVGTSLDRIDPDGDYTPENCRWATKEEQAANKRTAVWLAYKGERWCLQQLAKRLKISPSTLKGRVQRGWPEDQWNAPSRVNDNHVSRRYAGALPLAQT